MSQPTISDVALAAGVSVATVSRAMRGLDKVHPETRERVLRAAAELDYIASPTAAGLASGRSRLIGIITPFIARWFFTEMLSAIEHTVREHQHHILLMDLEQPVAAGRVALTQGMLFKRVDGLIVINAELQEPERDLIRRLDLPVVAVGSRHDEAPLIGIDDHRCATLATQHVLELGHRQVAYLGAVPEGFSTRLTPRARLEGFQATMAAHQLPLADRWVIECDWSVGDAYLRARELLAGPERPTAVLAASDEMALGVMAAARDLGLAVPSDLSVIGIDDHDMARVFGLTTVRQDVHAQGVAAAQALLAQLDLAPPHLAADHTFPVELVARASTAAPSAWSEAPAC